jgi:hypothetical protein
MGGDPTAISVILHPRGPQWALIVVQRLAIELPCPFFALALEGWAGQLEG